MTEDYPTPVAVNRLFERGAGTVVGTTASGHGAAVTAKKERVVAALLDRHGQTYAEQAGIKLADRPAPLYQLSVLAVLLSARIKADIAVAAGRELFRAGCSSPQKMAAASWQERVDALGRGHYRRYDERTSTMLGDGAQLLVENWRGDLRRLRAEAAGDTGALRAALKRLPGLGDVGVDIFFREVQGVWQEVGPFLDKKARSGAERVGLRGSETALAKLVAGKDLPRFAAALVRASLDKSVADDVRNATG